MHQAEQGGLFAAVLLSCVLACSHAAAVPAPALKVSAPLCHGKIAQETSVARFIVDVRLPIRAEGRFTEVEGELLTHPDGRCEVHVRLRADTVAYDGPDWMARLTRSPAFLDAETHPEVSFVSQAFPAQWLNVGGAVRGRLNLRGRERPVEFSLRPAECDTPGAACPIRVRGAVSRRDFGMQAYRFTVKDAVHFEIDIRLEPAS